MALNPQSQRNIDLIVNQVREYMDSRAIGAGRIQPRLIDIYEDIAWQQVTQLRLVLEGRKGFGAEKLMVADIFLSDDMAKIRSLFNPTDQVSILTEIVQEKKDSGQKTAGQLSINDIPSMYRALDPSLEKIILLIQCWIWWDLEDAIDLIKFEQTLSRVMHVDKAGVPEALANYYAEQFRASPQQMTAEVVVGHELGRADEIVKRFEARRIADEGYRVIVVREAQPEATPEALVRAMGRQYMMLDSLRERKTLDEASRASYSKALGIPENELTADRVVAAITNALEEGKARLKAAITGKAGGRPYDFKNRQMENMKRKFEAVARGRQPAKLLPPKPDTTAGR